jgi:hypothetical protein
LTAKASRKPTAFRWVAAGFVLFLMLGLALALAVHRRYVAYDPVAARHLPSSATALVRFDLTHVMFYEPFRRSLAPLAGRVLEARSGSDRAERLEQRGVRVAGDIREMAAAFGPERGGWTLVVGGRLPKSGLDRTLAEIFREEGRTLAFEGGMFRSQNPTFAFAQAADGALVLASSDARVRAALAPAEAAPPELSRGAGGLVVRGPWIWPPLAEIRADFRAGSVVAVEAEVRFGEGSRAEREAAVTALFDALGAGDPSVSGALERAERSLDRAPPHVSVRLPREAMLALANRAAAVILPPQAH